VWSTKRYLLVGSLKSQHDLSKHKKARESSNRPESVNMRKAVCVKRRYSLVRRKVNSQNELSRNTKNRGKERTYDKKWYQRGDACKLLSRNAKKCGKEKTYGKRCYQKGDARWLQSRNAKTACRSGRWCRSWCAAADSDMTQLCVGHVLNGRIIVVIGVNVGVCRCMRVKRNVYASDMMHCVTVVMHIECHASHIYSVMQYTQEVLIISTYSMIHIEYHTSHTIAIHSVARM